MLKLNNNRFVGSIPITLYNLTELEHLHLEQNFIEGKLSKKIGQLTKVRVNKEEIDEIRTIIRHATPFTSLATAIDINLTPILLASLIAASRGCNYGPSFQQRHVNILPRSRS